MNGNDVPTIFYNNGARVFQFQALNPRLFDPLSGAVLQQLLHDLNCLAAPPFCLYYVYLTFLFLFLFGGATVIYFFGDSFMMFCFLIFSLFLLLASNQRCFFFGYRKRVIQALELHRPAIERIYALQLKLFSIGCSRIYFLLQFHLLRYQPAETPAMSPIPVYEVENDPDFLRYSGLNSPHNVEYHTFGGGPLGVGQAGGYSPVVVTEPRGVVAKTGDQTSMELVSVNASQADHSNI